MKLALGLGMTLAELERRMSAAEMALWRELWIAEPWGEDRADARMGMICSTLCGCHGVRAVPGDFVMDRQERYRPEQSEAEMERALIAATVAMGGIINPPPAPGQKG